MAEDPLAGHRKTQLVLKIISGQQLPKPKDSMFGDRGEVCHTSENSSRYIQTTCCFVMFCFDVDNRSLCRGGDYRPPC